MFSKLPSIAHKPSLELPAYNKKITFSITECWLALECISAKLLFLTGVAENWITSSVFTAPNMPYVKNYLNFALIEFHFVPFILRRHRAKIMPTYETELAGFGVTP